MKFTFDGVTYNIPKFSQYADYEYALMCNCKCGYGTKEDSIVGIAEYPDGRLLLLRECPKCKEKWWCHISTQYEFSKNENADILYGRAFETVGCSKHNSGLFESMKKNNAVAIFSGHDHVNDIAFKLENILLVYVQYASYNAYNLGNYDGIVSLPEKDWQQGVTISTVKNDGSITLEQKMNNIYL